MARSSLSSSARTSSVPCAGASRSKLCRAHRSLQYREASLRAGLSTTATEKVSDRSDRWSFSMAAIALRLRNSIAILECADQGVHRRLRRDQSQRGGNVPSDPQVLARIAKRVCQRADGRLAVSDERATRGFLEDAVPKQRDQRRKEQPVSAAHSPGAADGDLDDSGVVVMDERHQERPESWGADMRQRHGHLAPADGAGVA